MKPAVTIRVHWGCKSVLRPHSEKWALRAWPTAMWSTKCNTIAMNGTTLSKKTLWESCFTSHKLLNGSTVNTALVPAKFKQTLHNLIIYCYDPRRVFGYQWNTFTLSKVDLNLAPTQHPNHWTHASWKTVKQYIQICALLTIDVATSVKTVGMEICLSLWL